MVFNSTNKSPQANEDNQTVLNVDEKVKTKSTNLKRKTRSASLSSTEINTNSESSIVNASTQSSSPIDTSAAINESKKKRSLRSAPTTKTDENVKEQPQESTNKNTNRRQTISSILDFRNNDEHYDEKLSKCEVHIRYQSPTSKNVQTRNSSGNHMCQKCGFATNRINLLVLHHKTECQVI